MVIQSVGNDDSTPSVVNGTALSHLVSRETLQRLQDRFAALGQVTVCICTVGGDPITQPTWGSRFSELIGTSPAGRVEFTHNIRATARNMSRRVPHSCHEGMTLWATPIVQGDGHLGVIVVGTRAPGVPPRDIIERIAAEYDLDTDTLSESVASIVSYSGGEPEDVHRFANVLADTIAVLYNQADRIERQLADLRTVHSFTELLSCTCDLQEMLDLTVRRVVEVMPVKACCIRLLDPETGELIIKAVENLSDEYLRKGPVLLHENAIDTAAFAGEAVYVPDVPGDPRTRYPENARREGIVSALCVPMTYRGETLGVIRVYTDKPYVFTQAEETLLRSIGSQAAAATITGRLWEEQARMDRVQRQVDAAAEIQRRMLPLQAPAHHRLQFGCVYDPTLQLGGDLYDFIDLPDGSLGICVADVVGKGLPAALLMASVRSTLRGHAHRPHDVAALVANVNGHMCQDTLINEFVTLVYGVFSVDGRTLVYCNAGHNPPILLRDGEFTELNTGGMVIGVRPEATFDQDTLEIRAGDLIVMITDGVTEAMDFEGRAYGTERLLASIRKHQALDAQQIAQQILWDVRRFVGLADQSDDITVVVIRAS